MSGDDLVKTNAVTLVSTFFGSAQAMAAAY